MLQEVDSQVEGVLTVILVWRKTRVVRGSARARIREVVTGLEWRAGIPETCGRQDMR